MNKFCFNVCHLLLLMAFLAAVCAIITLDRCDASISRSLSSRVNSIFRFIRSSSSCLSSVLKLVLEVRTSTMSHLSVFRLDSIPVVSHKSCIVGLDITYLLFLSLIKLRTFIIELSCLTLIKKYIF